MELSFASTWKSIDEPVVDEVVEDLVVLSGPNGSGKSQLLEAIQHGAITIDGVSTGSPGQAQPGIRLFALAQLVATAEGAQAAANFRDRWIQLQQQVQSLAIQQPGMDKTSEEAEQHVRASLVGSRQISQAALDRMVAAVGKRLIDFAEDDFRRHAPLLIGIRDPFTLGVGELFLTYHQRRTRNEFLQWRAAAKSDLGVQPLSDQDFVGRYGPPPWSLLDETLKLIGLEYHFDPPVGTEDDLPYEPRLLHDETGAAVTLAQLSSGEKTLMAVAMTLYTGSRLGEAIELPRVLLLDEADASLHPSMVASLLHVLNDLFVGRHGVRVIMTTHSPSTVALAPEQALYTMRRSPRPRLRRAARDEALKNLTVGVPTLSVSTDNRRQVFVESEYDEECYQALFTILRQRIESPLSLEFIASGKGGSGGDTAVKHLVNSLRSTGNLSCFGIVDRDDRGGTPSGIYYVPTRYALENLVLDPLLVGVLLLRDGVVAPSDIGLPSARRHFEVANHDIQHVVDFVVQRVMKRGTELDATTVHYIGGFAADVPRQWLDMDGHEMEAAITDAFPPLKRHREHLKLAVILGAVRDAPDCAPAEVLDLFNRILTG